MPVLPDSFVLMNDELWGLAAGLFGNDNPGHEVHDDTGAQGEERERSPDKAYDSRVGVKVDADPGADPGNHPAILRAEELFHTDRMETPGH